MEQTRGIRKITGDADVDDDHVGAGLARQHIDGGSTGAEVGDHLGRHFLGPRRDALGEDAVITCEHGNCRVLGDGRRALAGDASQAHPDVFQAAERASRLGQPVVQLAGVAHGLLVHRRASGLSSDKVR